MECRGDVVRRSIIETTLISLCVEAACQNMSVGDYMQLCNAVIVMEG